MRVSIANELTAVVREKYGAAALRPAEGAKTTFCGPTSYCCGGAAFNGTVDTINTAFTTAYKAIATAATVNDDPSFAGMLQAWVIVQKQLVALGVKL